ncbi:MAG: hypothetical protein E5Y79_16130 [Mesorhizobium sp.]|uniref:hypothetical protein n=1 Tax=Mesorhizobium sp. TaxID=1871066 RepID=UPI001222E88D|nr:hypothetical protein [Mesorhizobium sp.]TIL59262.1 MAG: hypothetical protein E5Y79_16130 [Mesorhizobium sp.]TIL83916.1 MAG: hypothetical protein E5Y73_35540 [Mesorhizobium sp.]
MVMKMGGGPNPPVQLDPFQNITGVHWKKRQTYVAFALKLEAVEVSLGGPESAPSGPLLSPTTGYDSIWLAESRYRYFSGSVVFPGVPPSAQSVYLDDEEEWVGPIHDFVVNGLPNLEDGSAGHATYAPWQAASLTHGLTENSVGRWIDPGGDDLPIPVLGFPSLNFKQGSPAASVFGPGFGTPAGYELEPDSGLYTYLAPYTAADTRSEFAIVSGVTVTYAGADYEVFGAKAVPFTPGGITVGRHMIGPGQSIETGSPHLLWVLCKRIEVTP